ncbi:MAG: hypothetical protein OXH99_09815 [Bryobacterales bacterium]|nr:hypothetical protein [Bryobacterales bacterium]
MGFGGGDLTVRPRGHVPPENVKRDLPHTHGAQASNGIGLLMATTGLLSRNDPAARSTLCTAARLGIPRYKIGYCRYAVSTIVPAILPGSRRTRRVRMCPLGQGMVDYPKFFRMRAASGFAARSPRMSSTGSRHPPRPSASTGRYRRSRRTSDTCARSSKRSSDDFLRLRPPVERPAPAATGA